MSYKNVPQPSGLGKTERQILEDKEKDIVDLMNPLRVTTLLVEAGVIDATDRKKIISLVSVIDQNRALLGMLPKRGADAFVQFVNVLIESKTENHKRLARILRNCHDPSSHQGHENVKGNQYTQLKQGLENHENRLQCLEGDRVYSQKEAEEALKALKAEIELKNKELAKLREKLDKSEEENEALRQKIKDLEEEVRTLKTDLEEVRALAGKNEKEMQTLKADAEKERGERELLSKDVQNLTGMVKNLQTAAAPKDKTKPPASTYQRQRTAIRPKNRFEEPERHRPELLKKSGGIKKQRP